MTYLFYFASYYAFVIVSLTWLAYFLLRDYLSYINSLSSLFFFCFSQWANAWNVRLYYPYWQYTDFFIFRFEFFCSPQLPLQWRSQELYVAGARLGHKIISESLEILSELHIRVFIYRLSNLCMTDRLYYLCNLTFIFVACFA